MKITIIDDEKILATNIAKKLDKNGYTVDTFFSANDFLQNYSYNSDLYIIDLGLGDGHGFDIIKWLREEKKSASPILIISGYNDTENKVYGLNIGADDYLSKPIAPDELVARVKALFRRKSEISDENILKHKKITFNLNTKTILIGKRELHLTKKENRLVEFFLKQRGTLVPKNELIDCVWGAGGDTFCTDNTINVTISKVRKKLGSNFTLKTKINEGYILEK